MKRRLLFIFLVVTLIFTLSAPAVASAAKPQEFKADGGILGILPSTEFPAGNSGRVIVEERTVVGYLGIYEPSDLNGMFYLTYRANVELYTQEGNFHGTLEVDGYTLNVNGKTSSDPYTVVYEFDEYGNVIGAHLEMVLYINGNWTFADGAQGTGKMDAWVVTLLTMEGHIYGFGDSDVSMYGKWH